jgi:hypothetical protein
MVKHRYSTITAEIERLNHMTLLSSLRRRWILACALFLLTLAATAYGLLKLPSTYQSTSSIVLLAPKNTAKAYGGNPYLAFNSTLNMTADVVRYETNDSRTVNLLSARGYTADYLVTDATDTAGPVLIVTVTGKNKAMVESTLSAATSEISIKLEGLQANLTAANKIHSLVITFEEQPTTLTSKKARPLSVIAGGGIALSIGITLLVDAILIRRRAQGSPPARTDESRPPRRDESRPPRRTARVPAPAKQSWISATGDRAAPTSRSGREGGPGDVLDRSDESSRTERASGVGHESTPTARRH